MSLRHEVADLVAVARSLGRDVPPVLEELFQYLADAIDGVPHPAPAAPAPEPAAEPAPAEEPAK